MRILICLMLVALTTGMRWEGQDRGGGDDVGLEFLTIAQTVLADLENNQNFLFLQVQSANLNEIVNGMRVLTVDTALKVTAGNLTQDSVAVNDRSQLVILVNRKRWVAITDSRVKAGIVLHEILSLAGLEETGFYPISSRYVTALGAPADSIKPIKDQDPTYLSCVDTASALLVLSISPTYRLNAEMRALGSKNIRMLQSFARTWGLVDWEKVVALGFEIQAKAWYPNVMGTMDNLCKLDAYNRAVLNCTDQGAFRREAREFVFKLADGTSVKMPGDNIWFDISETSFPTKKLEMKLVADVPRLGSGDAGNAFISFKMDAQSCR
ncbi:hypothetical protein D3C72_905640 [compost metagenome]